MNTEPVLIVDDDADDRDFIEEAWKELNYPNKLLFFKDGEEAFKFMDTEKVTPFLILSDINLPRMNGFDLKAKLLNHASTRYTSIPFVFWSSSVSNAQLQKAYDLGVNGIFIKENSLEKLKQLLTEIVKYWDKSKVPD